MKTENNTKPPQQKASEQKEENAAPAVEGKVRSGLIFGTVGVFAAIVFGLLYIFVISPSAPAEGAGWSTGWFLFSFAAGLTMIVLPCTLPLAFVIVPLSMGKGLLRGVSMAVAFGVGVTVTLSIYGILAALLGGAAIDTLGADIEVVKNWVYTIAGIFAFIFALSEIGLMNIHMPTYSGAAPAFIQKKQEILKAFLLGLFLGNIGIGCPHPATPLILIEIATSGDVLYGWLMFLVHAIGRVLPLLLLAFLAILGVNGLNWLMSRKDTVERITGWAMVFVAGFILTLGLFTHDWWVNSGIHTQLEAVTQESKFNAIFNRNLDTDVAHAHGLEEGVGLFGQPLEWGHWFLVIVWLIPIWMWYRKKRTELMSHPSYRIKTLEREIDKLEKDRRQVESMVNLDELESDHDLVAKQTELDALEKERRKAEEKVQYGESGIFKEPLAQKYEFKILGIHRNYLIAISIFLALIFIYFMPTSFFYKSQSGLGHDDHGTAGEHAHGSDVSGDHAHSSSGQSLDGIHMMDGMIMNGAGEMIEGAHMMPDGTIMLADGTTVGSEGDGASQLGEAFTHSTAGLPQATQPETVVLEDGDTYDIAAYYVQKEVGNRTLRMLAYNGSVPGPFIHAEEGAEITINFTNNSDIEQTIHSHGIRIDNRSDGVPGGTQDPVMPGETFSYTVHFADGGVYWYHPHTREDYGQELGLYGNYLVDPTNGYQSPVNREVPLIIDDILIENDRIANFYKDTTNFALLGRFGNELLVNGEQNHTMTAEAGEVIRFFVTNVSNARTYDLSIPGAEVKLVGADVGQYEREQFASEFLISPAERMIVEAYFEESGTYSLMHTVPGGEQTELTRFLVTDTVASPSYVEEFRTLHTNQDVVEEFADFRSYRNTAPDKRLLLTVDIQSEIDHSAHAHGAEATNGGVDHSQHAHMQTGGNRLAGLQWNDPGASDRTNTIETISWKMVDQETGRESMDIPVEDWTFEEGELVKIRLTNDANADHVMQHPIHLHGQRFVVLSENGEPNDNLVWKDTTLVFPGETVDILVEMSNSGEWMNHCHISEHLHAGMMMTFRVEDENGFATGDEYRYDTSSGTPPTTLEQNTSTPTQATQPAPQTSATGSGDLPEQFDRYSFNTEIAPSDYEVYVADNRFQANTLEEITLTLFDPNDDSVQISSTEPDPLTITFVSSNNTDKAFTYPGSASFDDFVPVEDTGSGGSGTADDGHDHIHMNENGKYFTLIPRALAHGGVQDGHPSAEGPTFQYTMPIVFTNQGFYRAFVEFIPEGETEKRVVTFDLEVASDSFSIDNFGWSGTTRWLVLFVSSIILGGLLSLIVYRFLVIKE